MEFNVGILYYILFIEKNLDIDVYEFMILVYVCVWILYIILSILKFFLFFVIVFYKYVVVLIC